MPESDRALLDDCLRELSFRKGSDLLLTAGSAPRVRIDGELVVTNRPALTPETTLAILTELLDEPMLERFRTDLELDFSFAEPGISRFRVNAFHQRGAVAIALRVIPFDIPSFAELDLPPVFERLVALPQGLILVTGPTGSGKSTTLASIIDRDQLGTRVRTS